MNLKITAILVTVTLLLSACGDAEKQVADQPKQQNPDTSKVLVTINDQIITEDDLASAIVRTVGDYAALQLDEAGRKKVLESLVMGKTMAMTQAATLDADQLTELARNVNAYRQELLTKQYLKDNISPQPVSGAMVKTYYQQHPERFGGKTVRHYEIVKGLVKLNSKPKDVLVEQLGEFKSASQWKSKVQHLKRSGSQLQYAKVAADADLLDKKFAQVVNSLAEQQVSPIYFFDGYPLVIRVTKIVTTPPKPLSEVSSDIRKTLLPVQLKKAIQQAAAGLSQTFKVEYQGNNE